MSFNFISVIIPITAIVVLFYVLQKKRLANSREKNRLGRRGKKDHVWLIIKDYLQQCSMVGYEIDEAFVFERPKGSEIRDALVKGFKFKSKKEAELEGSKSRKVKIPDRFEEEDYFQRLEEETWNLNREHLENKDFRGDLVARKVNRRKRFVIVYKLKKNDWLSDWFVIEVELLKKTTRDGKLKEIVVVNKELKFSDEVLWLWPLMHEQSKSRIKEKKSKKRS